MKGGVVCCVVPRTAGGIEYRATYVGVCTGGSIGLLLVVSMAMATTTAVARVDARVLCWQYCCT